MVNFTLTQNAQIVKQFESVSSDNCINYNRVATYTWVTTGTLTALSIPQAIAMSYVEWDITPFKHVQSIDNVYLILNIAFARTTSFFIGIRNGQPSDPSNDAEDVYSLIYGGTVYLYNYFADFTSPITTDYAYWVVNLGSQAKSDLYSDISGGTTYFAIGFEPYSTTTDSTDWLSIRSSRYEYGRPLQPLLYVEYTVNNIVTLTQPRDLDRSHDRTIDFHQFKSGEFARDDIGGRGRTIRMRGTEHDVGSETSFSYIDDMAELGEPIALSGFNDESLNTVWLIENFTWKKDEGCDEVQYDWELTLVESSG